MSANRVLTLLTDFGEQDVYVAVLKGAIAQVNPKLVIIDLTHHIPPQDLGSARFNLANAYPYFPAETVHIAIVDPGVGGQRRAIALQLANGFLVGPDNGIFSGVLDHYPAIAAVELDNADYWRVPLPSFTFHGRDIFATVGAYLASGVPLTDLGRAIDPSTLVHLPLPPLLQTGSSIQGVIQYIDRFGNLITNIPAHRVENQSWFVQIDAHTIPGNQTYADVPIGAVLALVGSHGWVEIAVNQGNAQAQLQVPLGASIQVCFE
jgi:S-adenosyl-L-methionine hydrolase (adenosine-forming)